MPFCPAAPIPSFWLAVRKDPSAALSKDPEYPRLRIGISAGPYPWIPRLVRGISAAGAGACEYAAADSADMPRNGNSVYATRGYSAALSQSEVTLQYICGTQVPLRLGARCLTFLVLPKRDTYLLSVYRRYSMRPCGAH